MRSFAGGLVAGFLVAVLVGIAFIFTMPAARAIWERPETAPAATPGPVPTPGAPHV